MTFQLTTKDDRRAFVSTTSSAEAAFNYCRAIRVDDFVFVSNTSGTDYESGALSDDVREQATQMLKNIGAALAPLGATMADVVAMTLHIPNRADVERVSAIISANFEGIKPTATIVCTPLASEALKVEMQVTAVTRS